MTSNHSEDILSVEDFIQSNPFLPDEINFPKAKAFCLNSYFCDLTTEIFSNCKEEHEGQSRLDSYFG